MWYQSINMIYDVMFDLKFLYGAYSSGILLLPTATRSLKSSAPKYGMLGFTTIVYPLIH